MIIKIKQNNIVVQAMTEWLVSWTWDTVLYSLNILHLRRSEGKNTKINNRAHKLPIILGTLLGAQYHSCKKEN